MDAVSLLVIEALLPEAKKSVAHQLKKSARSIEDNQKEFLALRDETRTIMSRIRMTAISRMATPAICDELRERLDDYLSLITTIRALGRSDQEWLEFKRQSLRSQPTANIMLETLDKLNQHRAITAGWLSIPTASFLLLAIFLLPVIFPGISIWLIATTIVIVAWRLLPDYWMMKSIKRLGEVF